MTPEQGYDLAKYQRPGFKVVMGPCEAVDVKIDPLSSMEIHKLSGPSDWLAYDLGFEPSLFAWYYGGIASALGHQTTKEEYLWLHCSATLYQASEWVLRSVSGGNAHE